MSFFKKRRNVLLTTAQQEVAQRIAEKLISRQKRLADYLNAKTSGISPRSWLWLLIVFCLVFGCYCLRLVLGAWS